MTEAAEHELLLKAAIVAHLVADTRDMIEIEPTKNLLDALDVMAQHQLMALPVYDPFAKEYEGIVTTFDIVLVCRLSFIARAYEELSVESQPSDAEAYLALLLITCFCFIWCKSTEGFRISFCIHRYLTTVD